MEDLARDYFREAGEETQVCVSEAYHTFNMTQMTAPMKRFLCIQKAFSLFAIGLIGLAAAPLARALDLTIENKNPKFNDDNVYVMFENVQDANVSGKTPYQTVATPEACPGRQSIRQNLDFSGRTAAEHRRSEFQQSESTQLQNAVG